MKIVAKIFDKFEEIFIVLCLVFMAGINFVNVVSRYCFSNSFSFMEETIIIAFVWVSMLGIAVGYKRCAHMSMSYIVGKLNKQKQAFFILFSMSCSLVMIIILIKFGVEMVQFEIVSKAVTPALKLPQYVQGLSMPVGGGLLLYVLFSQG
jgi:TRAP-type C4-dicarboxylate transport system permease small subunit